MESFWNKNYVSSFSSDICSFLESKFSDVAFYPEKMERHFSAVNVFQKPERESLIFLNGSVEESYFFEFLVPFGGEDRKATDGATWLLDRCLELCEEADGFSLSNENVTFKYFCRTKNPAKEDRTPTGTDWFSAEIKMRVLREA